MAESAGFRVLSVEYNAFLASYFWYAFVIYNLPLKNLLMRLVVRGKAAEKTQTAAGARIPTERPTFGLAAKLGFFAMTLVSALDRPFKGPKNMGFYAVLAKD